MKAYRAILISRFLTLLQYRSAAIAGAGTQLFFGLVRVMIYEGFYRSSTRPQPMTADQVMTYIWLGQAMLLLAMFDVDKEVAAMIRTGNVVYEMTRPLDLYSVWFTRALSGRAAPLLLRSIPIFVIAGLFLGLKGPASFFAGLLFVVSAVGGLFLAASLVALMTVCLLWTISGEGLNKLGAPLIFFFSGVVIPLPLFPDWMQRFIAILPFRGLIDTPFRIYLGTLTGAEAVSAMAHQVLWIAACMLIGRTDPHPRPAPPGRAGRLSAMLLDSLRLYWRYVDVSFRSQMQYRTSFLMRSAGHFLVTGAEFLGFVVLFQRFGQIQGWTLPQMGLFYSMISMAFAVTEGVLRGFDIFPNLIKSGDFDRILLRPRSAAFQVLGQDLQLMRIGRLSQALIVLIWSAGQLHLHWTLANVTLLLGAVAGGVCLFSGLFVLQATMCFWTTESLEIVNCTTYGGVETAQFPVTIYRGWFRALFTFVIPLATINYFPIHAILGLKDSLGSTPLLQWLSPLAGVLFLLVCLQFWRFGMKRYTSTGN